MDLFLLLKLELFTLSMTFGSSLVVERRFGGGNGGSLLLDGGALEGLEFAEGGLEFAR